MYVWWYAVWLPTYCSEWRSNRGGSNKIAGSYDLVAALCDGLSPEGIKPRKEEGGWLKYVGQEKTKIFTYFYDAFMCEYLRRVHGFCFLGREQEKQNVCVFTEEGRGWSMRGAKKHQHHCLPNPHSQQHNNRPSWFNLSRGVFFIDIQLVLF